MKKKFIVLVDDDPVSLRIGINVLEEIYSVATAPSANKLFSLLENSSPDLILLDIEMPEMNGYEILALIKEKPETKNIPVIFLTGKSDLDCKLKSFSLGAIDYITKPILPSLLLSRLEAHFLLEEP